MSKGSVLVVFQVAPGEQTAVVQSLQGLAERLQRYERAHMAHLTQKVLEAARNAWTQARALTITAILLHNATSVEKSRSRECASVLLLTWCIP